MLVSKFQCDCKGTKVNIEIYDDYVRKDPNMVEAIMDRVTDIIYEGYVQRALKKMEAEAV